MVELLLLHPSSVKLLFHLHLRTSLRTRGVASDRKRGRGMKATCRSVINCRMIRERERV
jgi:hypothetical protein